MHPTPDVYVRSMAHDSMVDATAQQNCLHALSSRNHIDKQRLDVRISRLVAAMPGCAPSRS